jgi:hypothetical protein
VTDEDAGLLDGTTGNAARGGNAGKALSSLFASCSTCLLCVLLSPSAWVSSAQDIGHPQAADARFSASVPPSNLISTVPLCNSCRKALVNLLIQPLTH